MSARVTVVCDVTGCGAGRHTGAPNLAGARGEAALHGWAIESEKGLTVDRCPEHRRPALRLITSQAD